jgi:hypothetical protein
MDKHDWPYIKKSARRKKRLVKKDFDQKLLQLNRRMEALHDQIGNLPSIILEHPYQRGWMRSFILRADVARSDKAEFYQELLDKINTFCWHYDRSFKRRKIRKGTYQYYDVKLHQLRELLPEDFHGNKLRLTDAEKRCFYSKETWDIRYNRWENRYVFTEAWRYILAIKPHMVYAKKQIDEVLEQELSEIDNRIDGFYLQPRMWKLKGGKYKYWKGEYEERKKYKNEFKNKPTYILKQEYLDQLTTPLWAI